MRIVAALGGNALLRRGDKPDADTQIRNVQTAAAQLAALAADHELVITHGNGLSLDHKSRRQQRIV